MTPVGAFGVVAGVTRSVVIDDGDDPTEFTAVTENATGTPLVRPSIMQNRKTAVQTTVPARVTRYVEIGSPPSDNGASQLTVTWRSPRIATSDRGATGIVAGITGALGVLTTESPFEVRATTVAVYEVPLVSPVITHSEVRAVHECPPGCTVAVYPVMGRPPFDPGIQRIAAAASPRVAMTAVTAEGSVTGDASTFALSVDPA